MERHDPRRRTNGRAGVLPGPVRLRALGDARRRAGRPAEPGPDRGAAGRARMTARLFLPRDAGALAVGAEAVARALAAGLRARNQEAEIVRTGSRGLYWLEPMIEIETPEGRIAYGPVAAEDMPGLLDAALLEGGAHPLRLGRPDALPFLARQTRLTFARCGIVDPRSLAEYRAHGGYRGL